MAAAKAISFLNSLSAEPAVILYSFAVYWYNFIIPNLVQQKVCSPELPPPVDYICKDLNLLATATDIVTTRSTLRDGLPAVIILLAGCWRDATSLNKPIMYFAITSEIVGISIQIFAYLNWTISPWITFIAEGITNGLGGGSKLFFIGATCAITDQTGSENRTARVTLISALISSGACLAYGISGFCLIKMGYRWYLIMAIILQIASYLLVMVFVKDIEIREEKREIHKMLKHLKVTALKKRTNNTIVWLMVFSSCLMSVISSAEGNVFVYYLQKGFGFSIEEVGVYNSYRQMVGAVSTIVAPPILTKLLKWGDFKIGIISCGMTMISCISMACAKTKRELVIFALFDFLRTILYGLPKSAISKCVDGNEIGQFVSFCYIGECILPIGVFYLYDYIYTATSTKLPGAFYLASAVSIAVSLIFYSYSSCVYSPSKANDEDVKNVSDELEKFEKVSVLEKSEIGSANKIKQ